MPKKLPKTDVVVVGVGWAGGIIASELCKEGINVVGLERGKERNTKDFFMVHDELRYAHRNELMQDVSKETITFRNARKQRALPMRQLGSFLLGEGLGGAGIHWNGQTVRFHPYDFEIKTLTEKRYGKEKTTINGINIQDWGITYDELEPYFDQFEQMAGISGEENPLHGKRSNPYPNPPMKTTPMIQMFKEATKKMGYHPIHLPSANMSQDYVNPDGQKMSACEYCAFCERFGCEYGAKADPIVTVIPVAEESGNFDLRTDSNVTEVVYDGKKASGVIYVDSQTGERYEQPADVVVLTSYVFNNVRLLLSSGIGEAYNPETKKGIIGKNYCYQIPGGSSGFFENEKFNIAMGAGALGACLDDFNADNFDHTDLDFIHGGTIQITQTGRRPIASNPVPPGTPSWGKEFKEQSLKYFNRNLSVGAQGASMPHSENYLDLDPKYKDIYGNPLLRMTYNFTENDRNMSYFLREQTGKILKEMGADIVTEPTELQDYTIVPYQSTHNTGGAIMGDDPNISAVNTYQQVWDAENVFVTGASSFVHNSGYNPTATVGALAYRAAEGIIQYSKDGGMLD